MIAVKRTLSSEIKTLEIRNIADAHIGDAFCNIKLLKSDLDYIRDTPNCYCIVNGDLLNMATKNSVSDGYAEQMTPTEQILKGVELLDPVKDKILAFTRGNHEKRPYRDDGVDVCKLIAKQLGLMNIYTAGMAVIFLRFGRDDSHSHHHRPICYTIACIHGSGGGRKEGAKAVRLADMASIVDADIYLHSHTHLAMVIPEAFYRTDTANSAISKVDRLFVNTGTYLDYGGYGEEYEFKPNTLRNPRMFLSGTVKKAEAII